MCIGNGAAASNTAPAPPPPPPPKGHGAKIKDAISQTLLDAANLPLPAYNLRQAVWGALQNQVTASPTNEGEAEELRKMKQGGR